MNVTDFVEKWRVSAASERADNLPEQIATVRDIVTAWSGDVTAADIARSFKGTRKKDLTSVLDSLAALGLVIAFDTPDGRRWRRPDRSVHQ